MEAIRPLTTATTFATIQLHGCLRRITLSAYGSHSLYKYDTLLIFGIYKINPHPTT
jgi:hypothetical protein